MSGWEYEFVLGYELYWGDRKERIRVCIWLRGVKVYKFWC